MLMLDLEKAEKPEIKLPTCSPKSKRVWEKHLLLLYLIHQSFWLWITTKWKILQEMGLPDHLTSLLRNLYAGQATVRTGHGTTDWFQIGKGVHQGCILSPCLFNFYAEYIMKIADYWWFFLWSCMDVRVGLWRLLKNWCFWTVVLEKTLESPLDCKEIQPVHSKGDQS